MKLCELIFLVYTKEVFSFFMDEYLKDLMHFRNVIDESRIDNRTLVIELEDCLGIPAQNINSMNEVDGSPQYHVRYNDVLVIMYWDQYNMRFSFPNYFGIYEGNKLQKLVHM